MSVQTITMPTFHVLTPLPQGLEFYTEEILRIGVENLVSYHDQLVTNFIGAIPAKADNSLSFSVLKVLQKLLSVDGSRRVKCYQLVKKAYIDLFKNGNLPISWHREAKQFCAEFSEKISLGEALPWIANHREMTADEQLEILAILVQLKLPQFIQQCVTLPHATQELHSSASEVLSDIDLKNTINWMKLQLKSDQFPKQIQLLNKVILDETKSREVRSCASLKLCQWLNQIDRPMELSESVLMVMRVVEEIFLKGPQSAQEIVQGPLFSSLWENHRFPVKEDLQNLYIKLLSNREFPLQRKELLASSIPVFKEAWADTVNRYINKQLESHISLAEKKVLAKHLVFTTIGIAYEGFLRDGLKIIQGMPAVKKAAQDASDLDSDTRESKSKPKFYPYVSTVEVPKPPEEEKQPEPPEPPAPAPQERRINGVYIDESGDVGLPYSGGYSLDRETTSRGKNQRTYMEAAGAKLHQDRQSRHESKAAPELDGDRVDGQSSPIAEPIPLMSRTSPIPSPTPPEDNRVESQGPIPTPVEDAPVESQPSPIAIPPSEPLPEPAPILAPSSEAPASESPPMWPIPANVRTFNYFSALEEEE